MNKSRLLGAVCACMVISVPLSPNASTVARDPVSPDGERDCRAFVVE